MSTTLQAQGWKTCTPTFTYGSWIETHKECWVEGPWVFRRICYERTRTNSCDGSVSTDSRTVGPYRLYAATPNRWIDGINPRAGADTLDAGTPLNPVLPTDTHSPVGPTDLNSETSANPRDESPSDEETGGFLHGFIRGVTRAVKATALAVGMGVLAVAAGIPALVIGVAAGTLAAGMMVYFTYNRWQEQRTVGLEPQFLPTAAVGILDVIGVSGIVEGVRKKRLLTSTPIDPETAGESLGTGLVQVITSISAARYLTRRGSSPRRATGAFDGASSGGTGLGKLGNQEIRVTKKGLSIVENHLRQFGDHGPNAAMIQRLRVAMEQGQKVSGADAIFYFHELHEAILMGRGMSYTAAHKAALSKYGVSPFSVYHPDVIGAFPEHFNQNWRLFWGLPKMD